MPSPPSRPSSARSDASSSVCHARLEPVDDGHVEAEIAEAEDVLEQRPGVAAEAGPLRERRADHDRVGHRRAAYGTGCAARRSAGSPRGEPAEVKGSVFFSGCTYLPLEIHANRDEPPRRDARQRVLAALARPDEHGDQLLLPLLSLRSHRGRRLGGHAAERQPTPDAWT